MSDFPEPGLYRISMGSYTAAILSGEDVLRGEPISDTATWRLSYVKGTQETVCALSDPKGQGTLGVRSIGSDQVVYRLGEREGWTTWVLRKTDDGYTLSQSTVEDPDKHYFWFLSDSGMPIVTADSDKQSWVFDGPYPDV